jgi:hypothetical protein
MIMEMEFEADKILSREFGVSGIPPLPPRYNDQECMAPLP